MDAAHAGAHLRTELQQLRAMVATAASANWLSQTDAGEVLDQNVSHGRDDHAQTDWPASSSGAESSEQLELCANAVSSASPRRFEILVESARIVGNAATRNDRMERRMNVQRVLGLAYRTRRVRFQLSMVRSWKSQKKRQARGCPRRHGDAPPRQADRTMLPPGDQCARQAEHVVDAVCLAPSHQLVKFTKPLSAQDDSRARPFLADPRDNRAISATARHSRRSHAAGGPAAV